MSAQRIVWTTLPNGAEMLPGPGEVVRLRFSVLVAPRLVTDGPTGLLSDFSDFLDWPTTLAGIGFSLTFDELGLAYPAKLDPDAPFLARSDVWTKLFSPSTVVASRAFDDHTGNAVLSYSEKALLETVQATYGQTVIVAPQDPPAPGAWMDSGSGLPSLLRDLEADRSEIAGLLRSKLQAQGFVAAADVPTPLKQITLAEEFHGGAKPIGAATPATDLPPTPPFDFHQALAAVGQYPMLQRLLGLVVDLCVDIPATNPNGIAGDGIAPLPTGEQLVRGDPEPDPSGVVMRPLTRAIVGRDTFRAVPRPDSLLVDGMLRAEDGSAFTPITVDLDGAVMKLLSMAPSIFAPPHPAQPEALAALRTAGVSLALQDRAKALVTALLRAKELNKALETPGSTPPAIFYADDLLRGLRIDVWEEESARWSSLMTRRGTMKVASAFGTGVSDLPPLADEGYVSTSPVTKDSDPGVLYLPESMFTWSGWSLATAQPGNVLANPKAAGLEGLPVEDPDGLPGTDPTSSVAPQPGLDVVVKANPAPGSLPLLRFGGRYRLRARAMDLAGNGPPLGDPAGSDFARATPVFPFGRFEPVAAPEVLFHEPRTEGETVERVVIRSESPVDATSDITDRHIAPPKTSWQLAEQHGLFDRTVGGRRGPDPAAYATYATREQGGFGERVGAVPGGGGTLPVVKHPDAVSDPDDTADTFYYPVKSVAINYLPDPPARGACFRGLPAAATPQKYAFLSAADSWPTRRPFRLSLREGAGPPTFAESSGERVLSVFLEKADVVEVLLSSHLWSGDENRMALFDWVKALNPPFAETARPWIDDGLVWAFTPFRTLTLVHAVRVPLSSPEPDGFVPSRNPGDTFAEIDGLIRFSHKSTSRVDAAGSWTDCVDDPAVTITDTAQFARPAEAPAFSIDADRTVGPGDEIDDRLVVKDRHEFGDTRHRVVTYAATAVTRFAECFTERLARTAGPVGTELVATGATAGLVKGSVTVKTRGGDHAFAEGTDYTVDYAAGGISLIVKPFPGPTEITFPAIRPGTELDIAWLANPVSVSSKVPVDLSIPSSARPAPPLVEYIVPTFDWSDPQPPGTPGPLSSVRHGKGLRVYLRRPWFSSGCGEILGVVLWHAPKPVSAVFPNAPEHVTHWALDPIYTSTPLPSGWPSLGSFPRSAAEDQGHELILPEFGEFVSFGQPMFVNLPVDVAGHQVQFDMERQLWFCDIDVEVGTAYSPFIRLALARYQPNSLEGLELSQVVRADYAQLAPDRSLTVVRHTAPRRIDVTLAGVDGPTVAGIGAAEAWIEAKDPDVPTPELGWERIGSLVDLSPGNSGLYRTWTGRLILPGGSRPLRLVVQQFERFPADVVSTLVPPGPPVRRLVHSDIVEL